MKRFLRNLLPFGLVYPRVKKRKQELAKAKAQAKANARAEAERRKIELAKLKAQKKAAERMTSIHNAPPKKSWEKYYSAYHMNEEIEENWVLYESYIGKGMICNPHAIFKAFMMRDDFSDYLHIWVLNTKEEEERLRKKFSEYSNIRFIQFQSKAYAYYLAKSKFLINNTSFPAVFSKRDGQIFVNTWHSITVKSLGFDTPDGPRVIKNMLRNMLQADYILSANSFMTRIFNDSFRLRNIYRGKIVEEGSPRNDAFFTSKKEDVIASLKELGVEINPDKKVILYAPTWTGNASTNPIIDMTKYVEFNRIMQERFSDEYQILVKPHHVVYSRLTSEEIESGLYIPPIVDTNELLSLVDILVTDYSSIYFDFLPANKPVLFYVPDYEEYEKMRGIYFKLDELPGPFAYDLETIASFIENIDEVKEKYAEVMKETTAWACKYDDGKVSERILSLILDNNNKLNLLSAKNEGKKTILIYPGGLHMNGVTSAFKSLISKIDFEKYDVSVFAIEPKGDVANSNLDSIPSEIRVFVRFGNPAYSSKQRDAYDNMLANGLQGNEEQLKTAEYMGKREFFRCFGYSKFDYIIDFYGYGIYFPIMAITGSPSSKIFMWQHSDMKNDNENGEKRKLNNTKSKLSGLISLYDYCDKIVSASDGVFEINKQNLATKKTVDKFTFCNNLIDEQRIEAAIKTYEFCEFNGKKYIKIDDEKNSSGVCKTVLVPILRKENSVVFANVGRCMPEKNQRNLIVAIDMLRKEGVDAKLYIVGDGHLRPELEQLIESLGLSEDIAITGFVSNPFAILRESDCFLFPSDYEAQGLAVLEARMINMPIVVNNYPAVNSVLIEDKQYIMENARPESILEGMKAYIRGEVPTDYVFDLKEYNKKAYSQFENLLD
ncbi:MAG: CDP-glycerol glycerophosphotransferase family protein [Eubacterium sp.]|nr:CDP-glycerol glycerophosphotransferase family protein [Eubacterium sp.]